MLFNPYLKLTLLLLSFFIFFTIPSLAQKNRTDTVYRYSMIKLNVLSIFDPGAPTWQPGFERRFSKHWAAEVALGLPFYLLYPQKNQDSFYHHNFKIKTQVKHYLKGSDNYLAIEYFRTNISFNQFKKQYKTDEAIFSYRSADFKKHVDGIALKFGCLLSVSKRWKIEPAAALGLRFVTTSVEATDVNQLNPAIFDFLHHKETIGLKTTLHWAIEAKMAYIL